MRASVLGLRFIFVFGGMAFLLHAANPWPLSSYLSNVYTPAPSDPCQVPVSYRVFLPMNQNPTGAQKFPLVIFLHGLGEKETTVVSNQRQMQDNGQYAFVQPKNQSNYPCFFVLPQSGIQGWDPRSQNIRGLAESLAAQYSIDTNRIYLTGLSMGGAGTISVANDNPGFFAAVAPLSPPTKSVSTLTNTPIWFAHSANDGTVGVGCSDNMVNELRSNGGHPVYTRYELGGHTKTCWGAAYDTPAFLKWMMSQVRGQAEVCAAEIRITSPQDAFVIPSAGPTVGLSGWAVDTMGLGLQKVEWATGHFTLAYAYRHQPTTGTMASWSLASLPSSNGFTSVVAYGTNTNNANGGYHFVSDGAYLILTNQTNAPAIPQAVASPASLTTNATFTASLGVDRNFGCWSTNGLSGPYFSYSVSGTNVTINQTTTLWYYGSSNGLTSATNTVTYTFDTSAPTVSGIPASLTTNAPFTIYVGVNENFGYWSTNSSSGPYFSFSVSGTNVAIAQTTTLWYFGRDVLGNTSATNSRTYTVNLPPAPPAVSVSPGTLTTNLSFTASLGVDKNFGYWSTNGFAGPYFAFPISGTNLTISKTTTLWYFGSTNSLTSATNSRTYIFDTSAPTVTGIPASLTTNAPFTISAGVNENFGYWSTNSSAGPYFSFSVSGTNVAIAQTTTLWYFGRDVLGNTSATNQSTFTFTPPLSTTLGEAVAIGSPYDGRGPGITFARLTAQAAIKIYSVSGKFVAEVKSNPASATGSLLWTVRQVNGERAPAGTYVCVLTDPAADRKILKVVVLP